MLLHYVNIYKTNNGTLQLWTFSFFKDNFASHQIRILFFYRQITYFSKGRYSFGFTNFCLQEEAKLTLLPSVIKLQKNLTDTDQVYDHQVCDLHCCSRSFDIFISNIWKIILGIMVFSKTFCHYDHFIMFRWLQWKAKIRIVHFAMNILHTYLA